MEGFGRLRLFDLLFDQGARRNVSLGAGSRKKTETQSGTLEIDLAAHVGHAERVLAKQHAHRSRRESARGIRDDDGSERLQVTLAKRVLHRCQRMARRHRKNEIDLSHRLRCIAAP